MPSYKLWQESDNTTHGPVHADNDAHAAAIFSEQMGINFTLEEGPMVASHMMARKDSGDATWAKPPDIPVWVKEPDPPN